MKINILGSEWTIEYRSPAEDDFLSKTSDGYTDPSVRLIAIVNEVKDNELQDFIGYRKQILRHEIIHAFMFESGLGHNVEHKPYGQEETMIDWIAMQFPKIYRAFVEADAL